MTTTEVGVSILLKSWLWCLVAVLTACVLEQWVSSALLGWWFFLLVNSQRSSKYFSFILPRFITPKKKKIILSITELKQANKWKQTIKTNQKVKKLHQVLELITQETLRYSGLQGEPFWSQIITVLQTRYKLFSKPVWVSVLPKRSWELKRNLQWNHQLAFVAPKQNILSFIQRSLADWAVLQVDSGSYSLWFSAGQDCIPQHMQITIVLKLKQKKNPNNQPRI